MKRYDLIVYGGSPGGIACTIRAAREGLRALIVTHTPHLGGMLTSGLCVWDTQYEGRRAPVYDKLRQGMFAHYRRTYGEDSEQYKACLPQPSGHSNGNFEPKVARRIVEEMVARTDNITVLRQYCPESVDRDGALLTSVTFKQMSGNQRVRVRAKVFVDCSYEGDLMAVAGTAYRIGRESREEFNEPHAGRIFVKHTKTAPNERLRALGEVHDRLNLRPFPGFQKIVEAEGSGEADHRVQAYNWRVASTNVPENRLDPVKPDNYDPERYKHIDRPGLMDLGPPPNGKMRINRPQLVELQHAYPDGSWEERHKIMDAHWNALQGCLYFLQHDPSVPDETRHAWQQWGLAKDEFSDNGNRPYEIYARETRRLEGRQILTEHDATLADGTERAPVRPDSVAITEWYIDIHACSDEKLPGTLHEGKIMLHQETFPAQLPYGAILPKDVDNLLVPVCVSSSHVGWSTVRLEPTWMNIGEAAGYAAALSVKKGIAPTHLDADELVRTLAEGRVMISFFNDVDINAADPWVPAVQYFGTKGFFPTYDARAEAPLDRATTELWVAGCRAVIDGNLDAADLARKLHRVDGDGAPVTAADVEKLLGPEFEVGTDLSKDHPLTRGEGCLLLFELLEWDKVAT